MEKLVIEIKITNTEGKMVKANIDYSGYLETKKIHKISLIEDVVESLIKDIQKTK